ncbi:TOBE domain-containing protein [Paucibacter sp. JuS9]|uniref:TOBE domain-containing protein n=1 Tax=Paucibacter sp. JuS9 TaxID=3228748 RepID=UPI0037567AED
MTEKKNKSQAASSQGAGRLSLGGSIWIRSGDQNLGGPGRIALLRAVAEQGSITHAAKAYGMSYKAAWDAIDAMNRVADEPLVERSTGGRGGGSTRLTERGLRLVQRYEQIDAVHQRFLGLVEAAATDLGREFSLLDVINMKTSARNQFNGTVRAVREGAVNDEVELELPGGQRLVAIVPQESSLALGLQTGLSAMALIPSSNVLIATGLDGFKVSARNQLSGTVEQLRPGAVNAEVDVALAGGTRLVATITQSSVQQLGLAPGVAVTALVKATDVVLAVLA